MVEMFGGGDFADVYAMEEDEHNALWALSRISSIESAAYLMCWENTIHRGTPATAQSLVSLTRLRTEHLQE